MEHINIAIENMNNSTVVKEEENLSIIERIMQKTGNPKIAAVLALDLFLVGVDTVWFFLQFIFLIHWLNILYGFGSIDLSSSHFNYLSVKSKSGQTRDALQRAESYYAWCSSTSRYKNSRTNAIFTRLHKGNTTVSFVRLSSFFQLFFE